MRELKKYEATVLLLVRSHASAQEAAGLARQERCARPESPPLAVCLGTYWCHSKLKGAQAVSTKLSSTHNRLKRNVDYIQQGSHSPELLHTLAGGSLVSSVRRKRRVEESFSRPILTLRETVSRLAAESQTSGQFVRFQNASIVC